MSSAYVLASRGHKVEVIDLASGPAMECSYANGGQLSYTHAEPWANPGALPKVFRWMFREDAPLVMRPRADLAMLRWGTAFLRNCTAERAHSNCRTMLQLGLYSRKMLHRIVKETHISFDHQQKGILHFFSTQSAYDAACRQAEFQETLGGSEITKTAQECVEMEPALAHIQGSIVGGLYADQDESGDIHAFTTGLAHYCAEKLDVTFHYNTQLAWLHEKGNRIVSVDTSKGTDGGRSICHGTGLSLSPLSEESGHPASRLSDERIQYHTPGLERCTAFQFDG